VILDPDGVDMAGHEVIGRGRTAEILAWGSSRAMKLYFEGSRREYVRREAEVSRLVAPSPSGSAGGSEKGSMGSPMMSASATAIFIRTTS